MINHVTTPASLPLRLFSDIKEVSADAMSKISAHLCVLAKDKQQISRILTPFQVFNGSPPKGDKTHALTLRCNIHKRDLLPA